MNYPVIFKLPVGSCICYSSKDAKGMFKMRDESILIMRYGNTPRMQFEEIIDADGNLYKLHRKKLKKAWAKFFAPIYDFAEIECELVFVEKLNIGEVLEYTKSWKDLYARMIKKHLAKYDVKEPVTPQIYEDFMGV